MQAWLCSAVTLMSLHRALASSALISLTNPITPSTLQTLKNVLNRTPNASKTAITDPSLKSRHAAVLIPFCNVEGEPGILLEVRAKGLRSHSGELRSVMAPTKHCGD